MRVALFGGSFDPIHHGHLIIARAVAEHVHADRVILLPSRLPPHKPNVGLADGSHRAAMVQAAIAGDPLFEFSDHDLTCDGPSYTAHTVAHFHEQFGDETELFWIIGADALLELHTWYKPAEILAHCRVVTAVRPGYEVGALTELGAILSADKAERVRGDVVQTPRIDISATMVRKRVAAGQSIRYLVPENVERYIAAHGLYTSHVRAN
ncbi:MAG: nicotinate (nicotinamide) nucleotide adenylyltransferase [Phycisphaerales bacterium]|nr:nicotinate (nicotinamide) nucleotide adenylyltransferase [Phycisphaerales bacterium]